MDVLPQTLNDVLEFLVNDINGKIGCFGTMTAHPHYLDFQKACYTISENPNDVQCILLNLITTDETLSYLKTALMKENFIKVKFDKIKKEYNKLIDNNLIQNYEYEFYIIKELWLLLHH